MCHPFWYVPEGSTSTFESALPLLLFACRCIQTRCLMSAAVWRIGLHVRRELEAASLQAQCVILKTLEGL